MATLPKFATQSHAFFYRISGGRLGGRFKSAPVLVLTTTGRKTGRKRSTPLLYLKDGESIVIIASNGGSDRTPSWLLNLEAEPASFVQVGTQHRGVRARVASATEYQHLWPKVVAMYPPYEDYKKRTKRVIPLVILEDAAN